MPNPAAPASAAPATAGAAVARALSGTDGKNSLNGIATRVPWGCENWLSTIDGLARKIIFLLLRIPSQSGI
jgi:hypothetical protein